MYTKPTLQQFGSFRELTQIGWANEGDGGIIWGIGDGCATPTGCGQTNRS